MKKLLKLTITTAIILTMLFASSICAFGGAAANEVKVQLNGENFAFTNAGAKIVNGKAMVPFRQLFEALDSTVTYDPATKTVSAKTADSEIVFAEGSTDVKVVQKGVESIKTIDAAPFIDAATRSAYVPARFFADILGYCVGWDAEEKTVILIDPDELFGTADEDFSIIMKLFNTGLDYEQAYKTRGSFDINVFVYETAESSLSGKDVSIKGKLSGIQQKSDADLTMSFSVDTEKLMDMIQPEEAYSMAPLLALLKNIEMDMKMDGESGTVYMHSDIFRLIDPEAAEDVWYKMNVYEPYEQMGIDIKALSRLGYSKADLSELLTMAISSPGVMDISTYGDMKAAYALAKNLIGDEAFRTKTAGNIKTHTLKIDKNAIYSALIRTAISEEFPDGFSELGDLVGLADLANLTLNLTITEKGNALDTYRFNGNLSIEGIKCSINTAGDKLNTDVQMTLDMKDVMKIDVKAKSHMTKSSKAPDLNLPSGATVLDYAQMGPEAGGAI